MKSTVNKGILFYILLLCSIVVGIACVIMAILIFSPGTEIFGISYYGKKVDSSVTKISAEENSAYIDTLVENNLINSFNIKTDYININVVMKDVNRVQIELDSKTSGIIKSGNQNNFIWNYNYDEANKSFNFSVTGPDCWFYFSKNATIKLALPLDFNRTDIDLNLYTESGNINIGTEKNDNFSFSSLKIETKESSNINLGNNVSFTSLVDINSPSGTIDVNSVVNVNNLNITSNSSKIVVGDVTANEFKLKTDSSIVKIGALYGNLTYDAKKGVLDVEKITGKLSCSEDLISNIFVDEILGEVLLPNAKSSSITINTLHSRCRISTISGNVTINNALNAVDIETDSGEIYVILNTPENVSKPTNSALSHIKSNSGNITTKFNNIKYNNTIETTSGTINCSYRNGLEFTLTYNCETNKPTLSSGITTNEIKNSASIEIGSPNSYDTITINNKNGQTSIDDQYVLE